MGKSDSDAKAFVVLVTVFILTFIAIVAKIIIGLIHLARFMYWIFLILIPLSLIVSIVFFIIGLRSEWDKEDNWKIAGIVFISMFFFFFLARVSYNWGYSEKAIQTELELKGYLQWYGELMSVFEIPDQITDQTIQETINLMCKDPNYPCDNVKKTYEIYGEVKGMKDAADEFSGLLFLNR